MKIRSIVFLSVLVATAAAARAEPAPPEITAGVGAGAVAGALLAGPPGAIVGAALGGAVSGTVGAVVDERDALAGDLELAQARLAERGGKADELAGRIAGLEKRLVDEQGRLERLDALETAAAKVSAGILFRTGSASLDETDERRLTELAGLLALVPELSIHIEGHADVRGAAEVNESLSRARAVAVKDALQERGVAPDRLHVWYYGSEAARAEPSDSEGLAFDRRVDVLLLPADESLAGRAGTL
jgi:outer membrane protein OmpA-like peptidoglycan-associated protein